MGKEGRGGVIWLGLLCVCWDFLFSPASGSGEAGEEWPCLENVESE